jgi:hypothetical protein
MITIPVRVCGDHWINSQEVGYLLNQIAGKDTIELDFQAEGPGLAVLGILQIINQYCNNYRVDTKSIFINNWSNAAEPVPYTVANLHLRSHFFDRSQNYWLEQVVPSTHEHVLGFFIGRRTIPRLMAMHYLYHAYKNSSLLSCLSTVNALPWQQPPTGMNLDLIQHWVSADSEKSFCQWCESDPVSSLDGHSIRDQYQQGINTNWDILQFYSKFDIELVSESYTRGDTFFPTEKTVRPIMAAKPMLVYGPKKFLLRLRQLGFETYHSLWDESYDQLEGPDRWHAIKHIIDSIMSWTHCRRLDLLQQADQIAMKNRQHLAAMIGLKMT